MLISCSTKRPHKGTVFTLDKIRFEKLWNLLHLLQSQLNNLIKLLLSLHILISVIFIKVA